MNMCQAHFEEVKSANDLRSVEAVLEELEEYGMLQRYSAGDEIYLFVSSELMIQEKHGRSKQSLSNRVALSSIEVFECSILRPGRKTLWNSM